MGGLAESIDEGVGAAAPAPLMVPVGVVDAVTLLDKDTLGVSLAEAPALSEAVGEAAKVELAVSVAEGVGLAVSLLLGAGDGDKVGVALPVNERLPEFEELTPVNREATGEADTVVLGERVGEGVRAGVAVDVGEALSEALSEALTEALTVQAPLGEMDVLAESVKTGSAVKSAEGESAKTAFEETLAVCVWVAVARSLGREAWLGEMAGLAESVETGSAVKSAEGEPVKTASEETLAVCVWVATAGSLGTEAPLGEMAVLAESVALGNELEVAQWVCEAHAVGVSPALPESEGEGDAEAPCRDGAEKKEGLALGGADCDGAVLAEVERVEEVEGVGRAVKVEEERGRGGSAAWSDGVGLPERDGVRLAEGRAVNVGVGVGMGTQESMTAEPGAPGEVMVPAPVYVTAPICTAREVLM